MTVSLPRRVRRVCGDNVDAWDGPVTRLTDHALALAANCDDASKAAALLSERADRQRIDRLTVLLACRWRLAGLLDRDPDDLVALAALGLATLAATEMSEATKVRGGMLARMASSRRSPANGAKTE